MELLNFIQKIEYFRNSMKTNQICELYFKLKNIKKQRNN